MKPIFIPELMNGFIQHLINIEVQIEEISYRVYLRLYQEYEEAHTYVHSKQ